MGRSQCWQRFEGNWPAINTVNNPYQIVDCLNGGRQNIVTGARHVLRLVDGNLGNLPCVRTTAWADLQWLRKTRFTSWETTTPTPAILGGAILIRPRADINHSAAAVIADSVTLLSNDWSDIVSMQNPAEPGWPARHDSLITVWRSQAERT